MEYDTYNLVVLAISGHMKSFERLIEQSYPFLHRYVACKIRKSSDQEDVIQDILMIAFVKLKDLREPNAFKPWLIRIASNYCKQWYIKNGKSDKPIDLKTLCHIIDKRNYCDDIHEANMSLLDEVQKLPTLQRQTILDFYYRQLKAKEISFIRGIPLGTVKRRLHDGRKNLKNRLEDKSE